VSTYNPISHAFETAFTSRSVEDQLRDCDRYELAPLFRRAFSGRGPVLEAGSGSGRWVAWLIEQGLEAVGVDWSEELCRRAHSAIPLGTFIAGDIRDTKLPAGSFGGVLSLGAVEHAEEGPLSALREFRRLLRSDDGVAIVTVPFNGPVWRLRWRLDQLLQRPRSSRSLRRLLGKPGAEGVSLTEARRGVNMSWSPMFTCDAHGWSFYEYRFRREDMRAFLGRAGFDVVEELIAFPDEGLYHSFGRIAGHWDAEHDVVVLGPAGRVLRRVLPADAVGLMLCYVIRPRPD
jgi:SAM-dependent methyltransferase